jgi:hypothetical protein
MEQHRAPLGAHNLVCLVHDHLKEGVQIHLRGDNLPHVKKLFMSVQTVSQNAVFSPAQYVPCLFWFPSRSAHFHLQNGIYEPEVKGIINWLGEQFSHLQVFRITYSRTRKRKQTNENRIVARNGTRRKEYGSRDKSHLIDFHEDCHGLLPEKIALYKKDIQT